MVPHTAYKEIRLDSRNLKKNQRLFKNLADNLRTLTLLMENLKSKLTLEKILNTSNKTSIIHLKPSHRVRTTYGCYNPKDRRQYRYSCISCGAIYAPVWYKLTSEPGSPGYIFSCTFCSTLAFVYYSEIAHTEEI